MNERCGRDRDDEDPLDRRLELLERLGQPLDRRLLGALASSRSRAGPRAGRARRRPRGSAACGRRTRACRSPPRTPGTRTCRLRGSRTADAARGRSPESSGSRRRAGVAIEPRIARSPDHDERVALEEVVGNRRQRVELGGRARDVGARLLDPRDQGRRQLLGRQVPQPVRPCPGPSRASCRDRRGSRRAAREPGRTSSSRSWISSTSSAT